MIYAVSPLKSEGGDLVSTGVVGNRSQVEVAGSS